MTLLLNALMVGGPLLAGLVIGSWAGKRALWARLLSDRQLGQHAAEQLALRHGCKLEIFDLGSG